MSFSSKVRPSQTKSNENSKVSVKGFSRTTKSGMSSSKPVLQVLQPLAVNRDLAVKAEKAAIPKRKQWHAEQSRGPKKVKVEVKSTQTDEVSAANQDPSDLAYQLMVQETPPPAYWKDVAEERRKALFDVLQENERLHKDIEAKNEQISRLKSDNDELRELAEHVEYMADMITRLTGKGPDNLEEIRGLALDEYEQDGGNEDGDEDENDEEEEDSNEDAGDEEEDSNDEDDEAEDCRQSETEEQTSDHNQEQQE